MIDSMPRFNNRSETSGKKRADQIGVVVGSELKGKLEILAKYNKRTLSDFCKIELENVVNKQENKEILNNLKDNEDNLL